MAKLWRIYLFLPQALGIILEDSTHAIYRHICGTQRDSGPHQNGGLRLGSCFCGLVNNSLVLSIAAHHYSTREPKYKPLPFSLISYLLGDCHNCNRGAYGTRRPIFIVLVLKSFNE